MKKMPSEWFIALRYLKPRKDNFFVTLIGGISVLGVMVGVMSIILVLTVLNGFETEIKNRFVGFDAHGKIKMQNEIPMTSPDSVENILRKQYPINGAAPYILEKAMITSRQSSHIVFVKGTDEKRLTQVSDLSKNMAAGKIDFEVQSEGLSGILLGLSVAINLDVSTGDTVTVISPSGVTGPFSAPPMRRYVVTGLFKTDMYEYDNAYVFISIPEAQKLFEKEEAITGLDIRFENIAQASEYENAIRTELGESFVYETWYDMHRDLYAAMKLEKWGSLLLLSMIIMVAGFNIVSTLIMVVMQKTQEIGILKSIGANQKFISSIFVRQGLIVGSIGIVAGCIVGYSICFIQLQWGIFKLPGDIFFLDAIPMELQWIDFFAVIVMSVLLCLFATYYPARKAAKLLPLEALKS